MREWQLASEPGNQFPNLSSCEALARLLRSAFRRLVTCDHALDAMLANVLSRTATRAPHRVTLVLTRSKGYTSVPPR